jgi:hypothetical protein
MHKLKIDSKIKILKYLDRTDQLNLKTALDLNICLECNFKRFLIKYILFDLDLKFYRLQIILK